MNKSIAKAIRVLLITVGVLVAASMGGCLTVNFTETTKFFLDGNTLIMDGEINSKTPRQLREIFAAHPNIDTILMQFVPGSYDDDANLQAASWIAKKGLTTKLNRYSWIASGGTDFFLAGKVRIVEEGAQIGVHSWAGFGGETATDYEVGHEYHLPYIEFYEEIGWSRQQAERFYYFTINAAPATDVHIMTDEEILDYAITTQGISAPEFIYLPGEVEMEKQGVKKISAEEAKARGIKILKQGDLPPVREL